MRQARTPEARLQAPVVAVPVTDARASKRFIIINGLRLAAAAAPKPRKMAGEDAMDTDEQEQQEQRQALEELDALQEVGGSLAAAALVPAERLTGIHPSFGPPRAPFHSNSHQPTHHHHHHHDYHHTQRVLEAVGVASRAVASLSELEELDEVAVQGAYGEYLSLMKARAGRALQAPASPANCLITIGPYHPNPQSYRRCTRAWPPARTGFGTTSRTSAAPRPCGRRWRCWSCGWDC